MRNLQGLGQDESNPVGTQAENGRPGFANGLWYSVLLSAIAIDIGTPIPAQQPASTWLAELTGSRSVLNLQQATTNQVISTLNMINDATRPRVLVANTATADPTGQRRPTNEGIYFNHAYTVLAYNATQKLVTLRNPWGFGGEWKQQANNLPPPDRVNDGVFTMPLTDFIRLFAELSFDP